MPRLIEPESRTEAVVAAINHVLARDGVAALSIRSIARQSGLSTSSLMHHYESREHLLRVAASRTGRARIRTIDRSTMTRGALAFVPGDAEEVLDARAWLAWLELWRSEESLTMALSDVRLEERALLAETLDYRASTEDLDALGALIDGLLTAVCVPVDPMPLTRAGDILQRHLPDLAASGRSAEQRADELRNRQRRWRERAAE